MSDLVQVAIVGGVFGLLTPIVNHFLGRRDRALASDVVQAKNREMDAERTLWADERGALVAEIHRLGGTVPSGMRGVSP